MLIQLFVSITNIAITIKYKSNNKLKATEKQKCGRNFELLFYLIFIFFFCPHGQNESRSLSFSHSSWVYRFPVNALITELSIKKMLKAVTALSLWRAPGLLLESRKMRVMVAASQKKEGREGLGQRVAASHGGWSFPAEAIFFPPSPPSPCPSFPKQSLKKQTVLFPPALFFILFQTLWSQFHLQFYLWFLHSPWHFQAQWQDLNQSWLLMLLIVPLTTLLRDVSVIQNAVEGDSIMCFLEFTMTGQVSSNNN